MTIEPIVLDRWLDGDADPADVRRIATWLQANPAHAQQLLARAHVHQDLGLVTAVASMHGREPAVGGVQPRAPGSSAVTWRRAPSRGGRRQARRRQRGAAGLALVLAAIGLATALAVMATGSARSVDGAEQGLLVTHVVGSVSNANGDQVAPDQRAAVVQLVGDSRLVAEIPGGGSVELRGPGRMLLSDQVDKPLVSLTDTGSTMATVVPGARSDAPVRVSTPELLVTVTGTAFSVTRSASASAVAVTHGTVAVTRPERALATLSAGEQLVETRADQPVRLPAQWTLGSVTGDRVQLVPNGTETLAAGFGTPSDPRQTVLRYDPDAILSFDYRATAGARWIGVWWRNPATDSTYFVPLGRAHADGQWHRVSARLGDAAANGAEQRAPRSGDPISALLIQTGRLDGAVCSIRNLRLEQHGP